MSADATWNVPEPELTLVVNSRKELVGVSIGNDMSSRDIEGENLLYLPQAKMYERACAVGPCIVTGADETAIRQWTIDVEIIRVGGHAHYICREMELKATLPGGEKIDLLTIDDWDLDWQDTYQLKEPLSLPKGTRVDVRILYDNSADNPENPNSPPQRITWGRESNDEMGSLILQVLAKDEQERPKLEAAIRDQLRQAMRGGTRQGTQNSEGSRISQARKGIIERLDSNGDGKITFEEVPSSLRTRVFDYADLNGDKVIDEKEIQQYISRRSNR